jgi:hypothetical protein
LPLASKGGAKYGTGFGKISSRYVQDRLKIKAQRRILAPPNARSEEALVRVMTFPTVATFGVFASIALAQTDAPKPQEGYTGAYGPSGPATPYTTGPLPEVDTGTGRIVVEPGGSTKSVKAAPCSTAAHETDGMTTCIGIPDKAEKNR